MARYRVTGDIVSGAFVHVIEADSLEDAQTRVEAMAVNELHTCSYECQALTRVDSVDLMGDGEEM